MHHMLNGRIMKFVDNESQLVRLILSSKAASMTTLNRIKPGSRCTIRQINGSGASYQRLLELGLIEGTQLTVVRYAPLGDPIEVHLHGFNLSLRKSEAAKVEVEHA